MYIGVDLLVRFILKIFLTIAGRFDSTITVSAMEIASSMLWVIIMVVFFSFFIILYTSSDTSCLVSKSSAENGSSRSRISGDVASVLIKATL